MGRRWSKFAVAMLVLAALLGAAPAATAAEESEGNDFKTFNIEASNGYRIFVLAIFHAGYGESSEVVLLASRKDRAASYLAPATVTSTKIEADFGEVGRIAVEFKPTGAKGKTAPRCYPKEQIPYEKGTYVGEIEFHGERGYTDVSRKRVRYSLHPFIDYFYCGLRVEEDLGGGAPGVRLRAIARPRKGVSVSLQANQNRPGGPVKLQALVEESRGRVQIARGTEKTLPGSALAFDPELRSASLRPPSLFSGAAIFRRDAKPSNRWTGKLAFDFPGRPNVSLAGARFHASLVHARWTLEPPEFRRPNFSAK